MSLRHAVLGLLAVEPATGYDLTQRFEQSLATRGTPATARSIPSSRGSSEAGMVEVVGEGPRRSRTYAVTDGGPRGAAALDDARRSRAARSAARRACAGFCSRCSSRGTGASRSSRSSPSWPRRQARRTCSQSPTRSTPCPSRIRFGGTRRPRPTRQRGDDGLAARAARDASRRPPPLRLTASSSGWALSSISSYSASALGEHDDRAAGADRRAGRASRRACG